MTTKILASTDALGNVVRFRLMPGRRYDSIEMSPLIDGITFDGPIADKAFDSNVFVAELNDHGAKVVISQLPGRAQKLKIDASSCTLRHLIKNFFCKPRGCYGLVGTSGSSMMDEHLPQAISV